MKFAVAYDASAISKAALARAETLADGVNGTVTALTVIPARNGQYAREHGWMGEDESWDRETVLATLRESVEAVSPAARFTYRMVDKYAPRGTIGYVLQSAAEEANVDVLVIGSENPGRVFRSLTTVTRSVAVGPYDIFVVRST